jgi:hypothetical protein
MREVPDERVFVLNVGNYRQNEQIDKESRIEP